MHPAATLSLGLKAMGDWDCREGPGQGITRTGTLRETDLHWYLKLRATGREQRVTLAQYVYLQSRRQGN